jgi:hypothetical protein
MLLFSYFIRSNELGKKAAQMKGCSEPTYQQGSNPTEPEEFATSVSKNDVAELLQITCYHTS